MGLKSFKWLINTWGLLRQNKDPKGFFCFLRTEYSALELSCLQNEHGRFVEISEYHGGVQRGGIRVLEGFWGKGWDRFAKELDSFFPGKAVPVKNQAGKPHNGKRSPNLELRDTRDFLAPIKQSIGSYNPVKFAGLTSKMPRVKLDPNAPRPTRQFEFKWEPFPNTLHITINLG